MPFSDDKSVRDHVRWTAAPGGPAFYAYSTNYLIDLHAGIIMDVEATPAYAHKTSTRPGP